MLARNRFDPEALNRMVKAVQLRGEYQPLQPLGETDIEVCRCILCEFYDTGIKNQTSFYQ